jgi:hypothetical protein
MKTAFLVISAAVVCVALFAMVETVWRVINRPVEFLERLQRAINRSGSGRVYLIAALIGYAGFVFCGFYGLLFWIPSRGLSDDDYEARVVIAGLFTLASLPSIALFERYARLVSEVQMHRQTLTGVERMIDQVRNLQPLIESFSTRRDAAPEHLRVADLSWLRARADGLQRNVSQMIEGTLERERKTVQEKAERERKAIQEKAERERRQVQIARTESALEATLPLPAPPVVNVLPDPETAVLVTVAPELVNAHWMKLHNIFGVLDKLGSTDLTFALRTAPGVEVPANLRVIGQYRGDSQGGETELVATLDGRIVDLARTMRYAVSLDGLCAAFFIVHLVPTYGRFWHELYNYDYSMLFDRSALVAWLMNSGIEVQPGRPLQGLDRGPGLRVNVGGSVLRAAALGAGATTDLTEFSIELMNGRLIGSARRPLLRSKRQVLY